MLCIKLAVGAHEVEPEESFAIWRELRIQNPMVDDDDGRKQMMYYSPKIRGQTVSQYYSTIDAYVDPSPIAAVSSPRGLSLCYCALAAPLVTPRVQLTDRY